MARVEVEHAADEPDRLDRVVGHQYGLEPGLVGMPLLLGQDRLRGHAAAHQLEAGLDPGHRLRERRLVVTLSAQPRPDPVPLLLRRRRAEVVVKHVVDIFLGQLWVAAGQPLTLATSAGSTCAAVPRTTWWHMSLTSVSTGLTSMTVAPCASAMAG